MDRQRIPSLELDVEASFASWRGPQERSMPDDKADKFKALFFPMAKHGNKKMGSLGDPSEAVQSILPQFSVLLFNHFSFFNHITYPSIRGHVCFTVTSE